MNLRSESVTPVPGCSLLVDVRQEVVILLGAQDKFGVVMVEVHLLGEKETVCHPGIETGCRALLR